MRKPLFVLPGLLLLLGLAAAKEEPKKQAASPPTVEQAAEQALAAFRTGEKSALRRLAQQRDPDPWMVADRLCVRREFDAAEALARSAPGPDLARLPAYIALRRRRAPGADVRAALTAGYEASNVKQATVAVDLLEAQRGRGDRFERALVETLRADLLEKLERAEEALNAYMQGAELAEEIGWLPQASWHFLHSGILAGTLRRYPVMLRAAKSLWRVEVARGSIPGQAMASMLLAKTTADMGDYDRGLHHVLEAVRLYEESDDVGGRADARMNLALMHQRRGEYPRAQAAAERALGIAEGLEDRPRRARALALLGNSRAELWDPEGALLAYREALELFRLENSTEEFAECLGNMAIALARQKKYPQSLTRMQQALKIFTQLKHNDSTCLGFIMVGWIQTEAGMLDLAAKNLHEALRWSRSLEDPRLQALALSHLADTETRRGRLEPAREHAGEVVRIATRMEAQPLLLSAHRTLAEIALAEKQYGRSVDEAHRALGYARHMLGRLDQETGSRARERLTRLYDTASAAAVAWDRPAELFEFLESGRAGALLEALEGREELRDAAIPKALRAAEQAAKCQVRTAQVQYQQVFGEGKRKPLRRARATLEAAHAVLQEATGRIQREAKAAATVLYPEAVSLDELLAELAAGEVLVVYGALAQEFVALVVTPDGARIVRLGERVAIEQAAELALEDPRSKPGEAIQRLAALLVAPLALPKTTKRLLISPVGVIGYVPFGLLTDINEVALVPSGTAYLTLREQAGLSGRFVLALGDPTYPAGATGGGTARSGLGLSPLPETRVEARAVGDVLLLGEKATVTALSHTLGTRPRWRAVHLACHGLVDAQRPMRSALALTPDKGSDGLLSYSDVFRLRVPADLAVLSACETGRGKIYRSEGIVGMTQAFMLAGAPRVICSLWKVDDKASRALMVRFYELWNPKQGKPLGAAAALKKAQAYVRDHPDHPKWKHPYYWAAWVLWGLPE